MTPLFRIEADSEDITAKIADRLLSLQIVDEDGMKADRLSVTLDDRDNRLELPEVGAALDVWLGFAGEALSYMGKYVADELGGSGPHLEMQIGATAANMLGGIRSPQTRAWEDVSMSDIVNKIAGEADLKAVVGKSLSNVRYAYLAQTAESNLHFLTRLSIDLDATTKPAGGTLVVQKRGEGLNAEGEQVEPVSIPAGRLSQWDWKIKEREAYKAVEAEWGDVDGGAVQKVSVGSGEPVKRLRHTYPNAAEAQRAAQAELALSGRSVITGSFELSGFEPGLFAAGKAAISGLRPELNGDWHIERVKHSLGTKLVTHFTARLARS